MGYWIASAVFLTICWMVWSIQRTRATQRLIQPWKERFHATPVWSWSGTALRFQRGSITLLGTFQHRLGRISLRIESKEWLDFTWDWEVATDNLLRQSGPVHPLELPVKERIDCWRPIPSRSMHCWVSERDGIYASGSRSRNAVDVVWLSSKESVSLKESLKDKLDDPRNDGWNAFLRLSIRCRSMLIKRSISYRLRIEISLRILHRNDSNRVPSKHPWYGHARFVVKP